ncbi:MAG: gamma-glutamylcyclotransferase [Hyphomonadaceae bacterium]
MTNALFVYGSLAPGKKNAHFMDSLNGTWQRASVRGCLHEQGWAAAQGYPGLVPDPEGDKIQGHVLVSEDLAEHWPRLDAFEGQDYRRILIQARLENGDTICVQAYSIAHDGHSD